MWKYICILKWRKLDDGVTLSTLPDVLSIVSFNTSFATKSDGYNVFQAYRYIHNFKTIANYGADAWSDVLDEFKFNDDQVFDTLNGCQRNAIMRLLT